MSTGEDINELVEYRNRAEQTEQKRTADQQWVVSLSNSSVPLHSWTEDLSKAFKLGRKVDQSIAHASDNGKDTHKKIIKES